MQHRVKKVISDALGSAVDKDDDSTAEHILRELEKYSIIVVDGYDRAVANDFHTTRGTGL